MTDTQTPPETTPDLSAYTVVAEAETRLAQLHAAYADARATADAADKALKAVTDAIKLELHQAAPEGTTAVDLRTADCIPLRLSWTESWRLDSKRLKAEDPETYVRYSRKSGYWTLRSAGSAS